MTRKRVYGRVCGICGVWQGAFRFNCAGMDQLAADMDKIENRG